MKTSITIGIALLCITHIGSAEEQGSTASLAQIGRYHIIVAPLWNPVEGQARSTVIKLDSTTGRVWLLQRDPASLTVAQGEKITVLSQGWLEVDKTFAEAFQEIQRLNAPSKK